MRKAPLILTLFRTELLLKEFEVYEDPTLHFDFLSKNQELKKKAIQQKVFFKKMQ